MGVFHVMPIGNPRQVHPIRLSTVDVETFLAVITLLFYLPDVRCYLYLFHFKRLRESMGHARMLLFAIVMISGTMSPSSLVIALREVRNYHLDVP